MRILLIKVINKGLFFKKDENSNALWSGAFIKQNYSMTEIENIY